MTRTPLCWRSALALLFCLSLALAPSLAEARAGSSYSGGGNSSSSMGSRGTRTFEQNGAAPITRSMNPSPQSPSTYGAPGMAAPAYGGGSFFQRHPFLTGLAGGFIGSMLFSHLGGFGHVLGALLTFLIIGFVALLLIRLFTRGLAMPSGGGIAPRSVGAAAAPAAARYRGRDAQVADADLQAFQSIHGAVQEAWSNGDLGRLRSLMTPEMVGYFSEELTRNASQGTRNIVSNINLLKGDVTEAWE